MTCRENDVQPHREEEIHNQNGKRPVYYRFRCRPADAYRALTRSETFVATDEHNQ